jgi:glycosyltransferase involved in cell wall biosynthesis
MRIGIVTGEYPPMRGGVGAYSRVLAQELIRQGHHVFVFSSAKAASADTDIQLENHVQAWGITSLRVVSQWAKSHQLDILNIQFQTAAYQMSPWIHFLSSLVQHIPVITTFHDLRFPYLFPKAGRLRDWIVMHLARTSDGVIVTNHEDLQRVQYLRYVKLIPIGSNILQPLPPDFDLQPWREKAGAWSGDYLLAYFGLLNRSKGLEILLDAMCKLRSENIPARLVIIGDVGTSDPTNLTYAQEIKSLIDTLYLSDFVVYTGFLESDQDVGSYLAASDAVVLPFLDGASYRRGSLMAAIRYACPIVTTRPQVQISKFVDGDNMLLVEPGNSEALANALRRLYHSPDLSKELRTGAAEVSHHFDWAQIAADYTNFLTWVIEANA